MFDRAPSPAAAPARSPPPALAPRQARRYTARRAQVRCASLTMSKGIGLEGRIDLEALDLHLFLRGVFRATRDQVRQLDAVHRLVLTHVEHERGLSLRWRRWRCRRPAPTDVAAA